jgi:hypothetical protein
MTDTGTGTELAVSYVFACAAGRGGGEAMARLHELVCGKLGADPALERLQGEARAGNPEPAPDTRRALALALTDAAANDAAFAAALRQAVGGNLDIRAEGGGVAAGAIHGDVHVNLRSPATAAQEPVPWPHQVGVIPPRARSFQHRGLVEELRSGPQGQVLTGGGGFGKTQLAADYARTAWSSGAVDLLIWINAGSRSAVIAAYAQAAVDVLRADPADPEGAARSLLAWLEPKPQPRPCRWLVVLDDIADPADLRGLWPPANNPNGRTLITTRRRDAALTGEGRRLVDVGLFTPEEATAYLAGALAAHDRHEPATELAALAADLGHLPLALSQAAAYLIDDGRDCATYRRLLADRTRHLADLLPDTGSLPDDQNATVTAAWSLSIERADQLRPPGLARPMLQLAAMLDANGIPQSVLTSPPALSHLGTDDEERAVGALRALHRLSLIDHTPGQKVRVHQLIQRAVRETLPADQRDTVARTAADALMAAWPDIERDTDLAQTLRDNTTALTHHAGEALWGPGAHAVLFRFGTSMGESGHAAAAIVCHVALASAARHVLGHDHPDALTAWHNVGRLLGEAGEAAEAVAEHAVLRDLDRVLGPDDPTTLHTRHDLACWRAEAGDNAGAAAAFAELLPDAQRVLGPDHSHTLTCRINLGWSRGKAGDVRGAVAAFAELLPDVERVLGPDHRMALDCRKALAYWSARGALTRSRPKKRKVPGRGRRR